MPKKGTPHTCPKCKVYGKLKEELMPNHIALECTACGHKFKSMSKVARRHWRRS